MAAYRDIMESFSSGKLEWIQFDQPDLVKDMEEDDIRLFKELYSDILSGNRRAQVM